MRCASCVVLVSLSVSPMLSHNQSNEGGCEGVSSAPLSPPQTGRKRPEAIKAVIFDLDGTLLDTEALSDAAILDALGTSLSEASRDEIRSNEGGEGSYRLPWEIKSRILGLRGSEWIPMVVEYARKKWGAGTPPLPPPPSTEEFWRRWEGRLGELCEDVRECGGATDLVVRLHRLGVPMAIATSSRMKSVKKKRVGCVFIISPFRGVVV